MGPTTSATAASSRATSPRPPARQRPGRLVWSRLPWWIEILTIGLGYLTYELTRGFAPADRQIGLAHAAQVVQAEHWLRVNVEQTLNHALQAYDLLADLAGYYYSTLHFIVTPIVLGVLWRRSPRAYPALRSALVVASGAALVVFVTWPLAPPRFAVGGMTDTLVHRHVLGMSNPHGWSAVINEYAAMPSLHVGWAVWCALAVVLTVRSRWRHLAWLYPAATTFVVLATANHYVLDVVAGAALTVVALAFTGPPPRPGPAESEPGRSPVRARHAGPPPQPRASPAT